MSDKLSHVIGTYLIHLGKGIVLGQNQLDAILQLFELTPAEDEPSRPSFNEKKP